MTDYDVAIVGAGPAGTSLAIQLAERGQNVVLLEKHTFPQRQDMRRPDQPQGADVARRAWLP